MLYGYIEGKLASKNNTILCFNKFHFISTIISAMKCKFDCYNTII